VNAKTGVTTVTTGSTFLPLNRFGQVTTFTVVLPLPWPGRCDCCHSPPDLLFTEL